MGGHRETKPDKSHRPHYSVQQQVPTPAGTAYILRRRLMLRRHPAPHGHPRVLSASLLLLLLQILVVGHLLLLLVGQVAWVHATGTRHPWLRRVGIAMADILGRLRGHIRRIDAVLVTGGFGRIETGLQGGKVSSGTESRSGRGSRTYLNEILALCLRNEGLQLGGSEGIDQASLRHDQQ